MDLDQLSEKDVPDFPPRELNLEGLTTGQAIIMRRMDTMEQKMDWLIRVSILGYNMGVQHEKKSKQTISNIWILVAFIIPTVISLIPFFHK